MSGLSENADRYAMAALRERRAEMGGELTRLERQVRHLRASMVHLDATLRLMDPDIVPEAIPSRRPHVRTKLFGAGKLNRLIMDAVRKDARPMSTADVVDGIVAELGYGDDAATTPRRRDAAASGLGNRVRATLRCLEKGGRVLKDGKGAGSGVVAGVKLKRWGAPSPPA